MTKRPLRKQSATKRGEWRPTFCNEVHTDDEMATIVDCAERVNYDMLRATGSCNVPIRPKVSACWRESNPEDLTETVVSHYTFTRKSLHVGDDKLWVLLCDGKIVDSREIIKGLIEQHWPDPMKPIPWDAWHL